MFKKKYFIILLFVSTFPILNAQPYYYISIYKPFSYGHHGTGDIYRININNPAEVETLMTNVYDMESVSVDEYGNWLAYEENLKLFIINANNLNQKSMISDYCEDLRKFSFVGAINKLIALYAGSLSFNIVLIDPISLTITDTISHDIYNDIIYVAENINFSKNGDKMYLIKGDSLQLKPKIATYSLLTNQNIVTKFIDEISYSGAERSYFSFRRNGIGVIENYVSSIFPNKYYNIYFLDKDSLSITITHLSPADAYVANNGKYLLLFTTLLTPDSLNLNPTGKIDIYDMTDGVMKKTIQLPPDGQVMCFENYPNNVYYAKDIELPTRQVWNLDMDSMFNELDLSSLTPLIANLNSPAFTLTVKGKGFDTISTVYFNGQPKTTTFVSDSVLTAEILALDVSTAGSFPVWVTDEWAVSDTLQFTVQASSPNLLVNLKSSTGTLLTTGSLQYYEGSWKDAVNNGDGTFTVITNQNNVNLRMTYEYAQQTINNVPAQNNTYTFQTVSANVQLKNSLGSLIDTGTVQYYSGAWRSFGTTANGVATKDLLPINYSFRMTYEFASIDKQQNLSVDPTVVFQTVNAQVQLKNSLGNFQDVGSVQYYAGAWRSFGTTTNGVANKELLPINYSFRMTYEYASIDKQQNLSVDPTVVFQTVNAQVQLKNSLGSLIDQGTVQYYAGAWRSFGTTTNGVAVKELLPINYSFRMAHAFLYKDKQQNLSTNPMVDFQTVLCTVKVTNSTNQTLNNAAVKYYAGAWRDLGVTNTDGVTTKELLPQNISFRASYGSVSADKQQDISANNLVEILLSIP